MVVKVLKLSLLNHLFYYTEVSGGATSAAITGSFIGDLALNYAFYKVLHQTDNAYPFRRKPFYQEIKDFGFYCSVARPLALKKLKRTESYIRSTAFNSDGALALGKNLPNYYEAGKSPFKTFRQVQGIALGSAFVALFLSQEELTLPPVIRVGTTKETLVKVEEIDIATIDNDFWLNAFSLKTVFDNLETTVDILTRENKVNFSYILESYALIRQLTSENIQEIFKKHFSNE